MPRPDDQDLLIVGATGDLARQRLLPALYRLQTEGLLPHSGQIIGLARSPLTQEAFRTLARDAVGKHAGSDPDQRGLDQFLERLTYVRVTDEDLAAFAAQPAPRRRLLYLTTPPAAFEQTIADLARHNLLQGARLLIEKPFGSNLSSARALDHLLRTHLDESRIFRIDHYLGKDAVQNILVLRFGNAIFERSWNRDAIDQVQITVAETGGMGTRGPFYDPVGALRDVFQNHLMQLLALVTMEPPQSFAADAIQEEKLQVLSSVRPLQPADMVRGQYARARNEGQDLPAYREEPGVSPGSSTETYVAVRLSIDNARWDGVPFYLRTGKRLPRDVAEIHVGFHPAPDRFTERSEASDIQSNVQTDALRIRIQPDAGVTLGILAREPGPMLRVRPVAMDFPFAQAFSRAPAEAYERLLYAALIADRTPFAGAAEIERAWAIIQPLLDAPPPVRSYRAGTWGPPEAGALIAPHRWLPG